MNREAFEGMVEEAVAEVRDRFPEALENVAFVIEDEPSDEDLRGLGLEPGRDTLFGLYDGTPLEDRAIDDVPRLPDRIVVFYRPLVRAFRTRWAVRREVRKTVIHEVAHLMGFDEDEVEREGFA